ncbi:hypothetical protein D6D15_01926 [Aureobasidium pullulans]|uniref:Uncharacterized protein n=1 Tax=Aureobasidium pullulans TaxID=5580 RepID=A0A4S9BMG1_AURPU|nr:hypothetical protein D6D15_01926 [Aureobasidium pullulans]
MQISATTGDSDDSMDSKRNNDRGGLSALDAEILGSAAGSDTDMEEAEDMELDDSSSASDASVNGGKIGNARNQWHENNPLLREISLNKLDDYGYINLETICVDKAFGYSHRRMLEAARWRAKLDVAKGLCYSIEEPFTLEKKSKVGKLHEFHRIHPIFRRDNWNSTDLLCTTTTNEYWERLKPVLQLATLLLESEHMIGYIVGMLDVPSHKKISITAKALKRLGGEVYWFERKHNPSQVEIQKVWKDLYELGNKIMWTEKDMTGDKQVHGYTTGDKKSPEIVLDEEHINIICREVSPVQDAIDWTPGSDEESARLRVKFNLATTMVHEVMHALWRCRYFPHAEPYYRDTRHAELGFQWEQLMYSGVIEGPTTNRGFPYVGFSSNDTYSQHADSLQILSTYQWPEPEDEEDNREALMSHKKWGSGNVPREYAVEMSFIQNFFTLDFWDEVDRYGSSNFFPLKRLGVRTVGKFEYWKSESPTIRGPADPTPQSPDDADERGIINRH